jgi:hypothetical protein
MIVTPYAERINALSIPASFARRQVAMHMKTPFTPAISLALLFGLEALNYEQIGQHKKNTFLASISELEKESGSPAKTIKTVLGHFRTHGILEVLSFIPDYAREADKRFYHLLDPPLDRVLTPAEEFRVSKFEWREVADLTKEIRSALDKGDNYEVYRLDAHDPELFEKAIHGQDLEHEAHDAIHLAITEAQEAMDDHAGTMSLTMSNSSPLPNK